MKVSELIGRDLDRAVAYAHGDGGFAPVEYSTKWEFGGPIIEQEKITTANLYDMDGWLAYKNAVERPEGLCGDVYCDGPTLLVAAMRCYVASKLGDEIDVPEELK